MAANDVEIAAIGEAAVRDVRKDGNKNSEAAVESGLHLVGGTVGVNEYKEQGRSSSSSSGEDEPEYPTEDERHTLRRIPEAIPVMAYWVAFCELAERFSYYGTTQVFQNFIQRPRASRTGSAPSAEGVPGALGRGQQAATALSTFNSFYVYLTPILGAYLADAHWGRFKTISIAVGIATIGHILLIFSSIPSVLDDAQGALACFVIALVIMGTGTGFFKSNVSTLIAEQVSNKKQVIRTTKAGERVILDPTLTTARLFIYFYLFINVGALIGQIGMSYSAKYVGFWLAYTLPTLVFLLCVPVLFFGRNRYIRQPPTGSVLGNFFKLIGHALKGRGSWNPVRCWRNITAEDFWSSALPSRIPAEQRPTWMTWDDAWVWEVRRAVKACSLFAFYPAYWLCYNQINNNLISQAATMTRNGVPNEIVGNLDPLVLVIAIPICDLLLYPALRRAGFNFTPIKRIFSGFMLAALAMVWAAVVQYYIYQKSPCGYEANSCDDPAPISVWVQSGSYILIALSEVFASITGLEYAFTKAPKNMKSLVMSIFLFQTALANALGEALVPLADDPLLIWNYGVFAVVSFIVGIIFWFCFRKLDKEEDALNNLDSSAYEGKAAEAPAHGEKA